MVVFVCQSWTQLRTKYIKSDTETFIDYPYKAYWLRDSPTGSTFNNRTLCPHCIYVFRVYLRTNSDLSYLHHKLIGFYSGDKKCLLRGTDCAFK